MIRSMDMILSPYGNLSIITNVERITPESGSVVVISLLGLKLIEVSG